MERSKAKMRATTQRTLQSQSKEVYKYYFNLLSLMDDGSANVKQMLHAVNRNTTFIAQT
jgi:hypothetical protein